MHAGFAMVEVGFTRAKNAVNILTKNFMTIGFGFIVFYALGYGFMFGVSFNGLIGFSNFFTISFVEMDITITPETFWLFQAAFSATAATIVSGAVAERIHFRSYFIMVIILVGIIYPVVGHWVWGGGWLSELGFHDFAGSTVVHSVGGWSAFTAAWLLGPRLGKYGKNGKIFPIQGHNIPLGALGVFILWFGWYGFNTGSNLSADYSAISHIAVTTTLAAGAGTLGALLYTWVRYSKPDLSLTLNGALAGLVGITAGCDVISIPSSIAVGFIAGIILVISVKFIDEKLKIDDPVGAISVHGINGVWGTLAVGIFSSDVSFTTQLTGVISVFGYVIAGTFSLFSMVKFFIGFRVGEREEILGLDIGEHGMESYAGFQIFTTD
tara:strand:+ start:15555 stop:16697 length:1143 start_codon:yes stop_codon:yes gene_type:complete